MILIVDFGSQTTHLIGRRIRDLGVEAEIIDPDEAYSRVLENKPAGMILSGGPASVYDPGAPIIDKRIFDLGIPILGICYGWQIMAKLLGGRVESAQHEYGPALLKLVSADKLFYGIPMQSTVWQSHGDSVVELPPGFEAIGRTDEVANAAVVNRLNQWWGVQFHPEVTHSEYGKHLLTNMVTKICQLPVSHKMIKVDKIIEDICTIVGKSRVVGAVSGGTDSAVAATLVARAIGKQFIPVYVDSALMRQGTLERVKALSKIIGLPIKVVSGNQAFFKGLEGISDPEVKRKTIGRIYIELFEQVIKSQGEVDFLLQGTTYADFIHSQGSKRSAKIKSHHNVGGLPETMKLKLLEPLRYYYTDQVRRIGKALGLPKSETEQQPFPGPGHAVRVVGAITKKRLNQQVMADAIVVEELKKAGWYEKVFQCWSVMTGANSTAVKGDGRFYGEVVALRVVASKDRMSADWVRLPYKVLSRISTRIVNEVPDVSRVVYDITSKPPATMEWE